MTNEKENDHSSMGHRNLFKALSKRWAQLCAQHLPLTFEGSVWRYSRRSMAGDPEQGWKLHVAATILTAGRVLELVAPLLRREQVLFKAPGSLRELIKINSGIYYGYSQVGKFITVYPQTSEEAARLARRLHRLTRGLPAPAVPFEAAYCAGSCVHYRYGAFKVNEAEQADGSCVLSLRDPRGNLVPDVRDSASGKPDWAPDLFPQGRPVSRAGAADTPLKTKYRAFGALSQRGKGGVYHAVDLSVTPPRLCVLKEGRRHGEVGPDGRDGFWRARHEAQALSSLRAAGVNVPRVYSAFRAERNYYLALEYVEGEDLYRWLGRRKRRLAVSRALRQGIQLSELLAQIHAAGWVWRDCKPGNIILTPAGELRPLDFEGACPAARPDSEPWGSPPFAPAEGTDHFTQQSRLPEDLYALGAILYLALTGRPPNALNLEPVETLRRHVTAGAAVTVMALLDADPERRPSASAAARSLRAALAQSSGTMSRPAQGARLRRLTSSANLGSGRRSSNSGSTAIPMSAENRS